jgi:hypothetical protein
MGYLPLKELTMLHCVCNSFSKLSPSVPRLTIETETIHQLQCALAQGQNVEEMLLDLLSSTVFDKTVTVRKELLYGVHEERFHLLVQLLVPEAAVCILSLKVLRSLWAVLMAGPSPNVLFSMPSE